MSWQGIHAIFYSLQIDFNRNHIHLVAYVDNQLLSPAPGSDEPKLVEAAILSLNDAGVWAISKGYEGKVCLQCPSLRFQSQIFYPPDVDFASSPQRSKQTFGPLLLLSVKATYQLCNQTESGFVVRSSCSLDQQTVLFTGPRR